VNAQQFDIGCWGEGGNILSQFIIACSIEGPVTNVVLILFNVHVSNLKAYSVSAL